MIFDLPPASAGVYKKCVIGFSQTDILAKANFLVLFYYLQLKLEAIQNKKFA